MKNIIYVPSIKKILGKKYPRDYLMVSFIDILLIDYILSHDNVSDLIYMPFKEEDKIYITKIFEIFSSNKKFNQLYFFPTELKKIGENEDTILITDILKIGLFYQFATLKPSLFFIPCFDYLREILNQVSLSEFIIKFSNLNELDCLLKKDLREFIKEKINSFIKRALI